MTFHRCFLPSFGSFGQTVSEEKNLKNQPIRNKNRLWRPCLLTDRDGMSNLYRWLPIDASYQGSVHLAKRFQRRRIQNISKSETRVACGWGRRSKCEKLMDDRWTTTPSDGKSSHCLWQGELKMNIILIFYSILTAKKITCRTKNITRTWDVLQK